MQDIGTVVSGIYFRVSMSSSYILNVSDIMTFITQCMSSQSQ